jgi:hypothetical protein
MKHSTEVRRTVLLWAAVTMTLWAALPLAMYWSHWQWFGWMPRVTGPAPPPRPPVLHSGPPAYLINMATLLLMSAIVMAVVLWLLSVRRREH